MLERWVKSNKIGFNKDKYSHTLGYTHKHTLALCSLVSQMREDWVLKCSIQAWEVGVYKAGRHCLGGDAKPKAGQVIQQSHIQRD